MNEEDVSYLWGPKPKVRSIAQQPAEYATASGCKVQLRSVHVEYFLAGIGEGHPDFWRAHVLHRVRKQANVVIEPPEGHISRYIIRAELNGSSCCLTLCWFNDDLNIESQLVEHLRAVDWAKQAVRPKVTEAKYEDYENY
jgi:hypothetical protein